MTGSESSSVVDQISEAAGMSAAEIDQVLSELGQVVDDVMAAARTANAEMEEAEAASEALLEQRELNGAPLCQPKPGWAVTRLRAELASAAARRYRDVTREFVAWFADLATVALVHAITGQPVHPARAAAADPTLWFSDEDLRHLPAVPEDVRDFATLAASLGVGGFAHPGDGDLAALARSYAAEAGLQIAVAADGELNVVEDGSAEARRCRLWGADWIEARVPALPKSDDAEAILMDRGVSAGAVTAVRDAAVAVATALAARRRIAELDASDTAIDDAEYERLWQHVDRLNELLAHYGRTVTANLPVVRAAVAARVSREQALPD